MKTAVIAIILATISLGAPAQDQPSPSPEPAKRPHEEPRDQRSSGDDRLARMKREIGELHQAGKHEEAERATRELQAALERRQSQAKDGPKDEPKKRPDSDHSDFHDWKMAQEGPERLRHMQEAIRHLHAAGMHEPARDLENAAGKLHELLERQSREAHDHEAQASGGEHRAREGAEGRLDANAMAAPMREMHRQLQEMREQMQKMARELQELREQSRRQ